MGFTTFPRNEAKWGKTEWSRPSYTIVVPKEKEQTNIEEQHTSHQPRFSVFGKKARFTIQQQQKTLIRKKEESSNKRKRNVKFDPVFLETVCLFHETESPIELEPIHHKRPQFRVLCQRWPSIDYDEANIILQPSSFKIDSNMKLLKGKVMVRNLSLEKSVTIRYSLDYGKTIQEVDGNFFGPDPKHPFIFDIFEFNIGLKLNDRGEIRSRIELSVMFTAGQMDYWDTNQGRNYVIKVICDPLNDNIIKDYDSELSEDDDEKHSQFTTALKGYQHARPYHMKKRQPWLGTRYDFKQSLYLAKHAPYETCLCIFILPPPPPSSPSTAISQPLLQQQRQPPFLHQTSKSMSSIETYLPTTVDINSSFYLDLIEKYCFYSNNDDDRKKEISFYSP
ncbi:putative phosphatase regulatory subunit-domain-containing protein [Cokeromyces recurvatus]|uniref:putative phosphatase regulatory subunit-domain-containing protein n=1 Tax=Cokeromyces recurvatus TaxID=90255 RepID=UPI00221F9F49|nr:putative phosphatase regulatory subunit-domain-containing protein [Cokeromyces recurvatus]KAI7900573.1 putative phosphatase regulatory subunit-domain-containing protein [Cokeromyces recurvatus]